MITRCPHAPDDPNVKRYVCYNCRAEEEKYLSNFWNSQIIMKDDPRVMRINHHHYMIGPEEVEPRNKGFSGRKYTIQFDDGRLIKTTNLWHQGSIPNDFWEALPDNAILLREE